jgi:hypothetical protein
MLRRALHSIGRRGAALLMFAVIFGTYGFAIVSSPNPTPIGLELLTGRLPLDVLAVPWIVCSVAAFLTGLPWLKRWQGAGFAALIPMPLIWAFSYMWSWVTYLGTHGAAGTSRGWAGGLMFCLFPGVLLLIAGWPDPPKPDPAKEVDLLTTETPDER